MKIESRGDAYIGAWRAAPRLSSFDKRKLRHKNQQKLAIRKKAVKLRLGTRI